MQKKVLIGFVFSALILVMVAILVSKCREGNRNIQPITTTDSTSFYKGQLATIQAQGEAKELKIKQDSIKTSISLQALKHENKELRKRMVPVRVELQPVIDSMAIVREFVGLTDSLDVVQEATIDTLSAEKVRIWHSFNSLLTNKDDQIKVGLELNNHFDQLNQQLSKDVKRERLKKTVWKIAAGVLGGALIGKSVGLF